MITWNQVPLSVVQNSGRTDAEYFRPSHLTAFELLSNHGIQRLSTLARITDGIHASPEIVEDGVRYISAKCVKNNEFITAGCIEISKRQHETNPRTQLRDGDVIITTVGTIGNVAVVDERITPCNCDRHVGIIRVHDPKSLSPFYLSTFLNSKYGVFQSFRESAGNVQLNLYVKNIGNIVIPRLKGAELEIDLATRRAYFARARSQDLYLEARLRVDSALGLDKLAFKKPVGYTARFCEVESSLRIDAEHFSPAFRSFKTSLPKGVSLSPLRQHLTFCQRGKQPIYAASGLPVVNSKHVQPTGIIRDKNRVASPPHNPEFQICFGDTLLNSTGRGTLGRAAPYLGQERALPDNHVMLLRSSCLDPVFLALYLNSAAGQMQVEMHQRGSSGQIELYPFDVRKFLVWLAPPDFQTELRDLYERAAASEQESRQLLLQATTHVEQLIAKAVHP